MTVTLANATKDSLLDRIAALVDAGTTDPTGDLLIKDSGGSEVARLAFSNPSFAAAVANTATANAIADDLSPVGGTAAAFDFLDRDNVVILSGSVGGSGSGADIILSSTEIDPDGSLEITSLTMSM